VITEMKAAARCRRVKDKKGKRALLER